MQSAILDRYYKQQENNEEQIQRVERITVL